MSAKRIGLGLAGCGTVGSAVAELISRRHHRFTRELGIDFQLPAVLIRDLQRTRVAPVSMKGITDDPRDLLSDDVDIVVELIGGTDTARKLVTDALQAGKHVVTANKALLAAHGAELFATARRNGVMLGFEASCAGGIPIIEALHGGLRASEIDAIRGILNGTCNAILTDMLRGGVSYEDAIVNAQLAGLAESDPTLDVSGMDSAQKLAILSTIAFGARVDVSRVSVRGIDQLSGLDLREGESLGYVCKLLAVGRRVGEALSLSVEPVFVHSEDLLASVHGPYNAVSVSGDAIGHAMFYGPGAGGWPTAGAVVADLLKVAGAVRDGHVTVPQYGWDTLPDANYVSAEETAARYYGRFMVKDQPGAVADITRVLGEAMISLAALNQHEPPGGKGDQVVPVIILTHKANGGAVRRAMEQIAMLPAVVDQPVLIRIEELPHGPGVVAE